MTKEALKLALENATRKCNNSEEQRVLDALLREALAEQPAPVQQKMTHQQAAQLIGEMAEQPAQSKPFCEDEGCPHHGTKHICVTTALQPAHANLWLYWKVDGKSAVTGPFKTHSKDEAYGLDCIDQTPLTAPAPQPAQRKPLTDEQIKAMIPSADGSAEANKRRVEVLPGVMGTEFDEVDAWSMPLVLQIARAIEAAHGIKEQP